MNKRLLSLMLAWGVTHQLLAESFTTNIVDGVATNITADFFLGDTGPYNFLLITNAARMTNHARTVIGNTIDAYNNIAVITGTGTVWNLNQPSYLGSQSPSNAVAVLNGAQLRAPQLALGGSHAASNNLLHVSGVGSRIIIPTFFLGTYGPDNQLLIDDGAFAQLGGLTFNTEGRPDGGRQITTVRGPGTRLMVSGSLQMRNSPANMLSVLDGAELVSVNPTVGESRSPNNRITVSGPGATWQSGGMTVIGSSSSPSNSIVIANGALAEGSRLILGQSAGHNSYTVEAGGTAGFSRTILGEQPGAGRNRLLVTGAGSAISNVLILTIGEAASDNSLIVSDRAIVSALDFALGMQFTSSNNQALATGTNTLWMARNLTVGSAGDFNTLSIDDGAHVFASSLLSGGQGGSGNTTRVTDPGSLLSLTNALDLSGGNLLLVTNNGRVETGSGIIGSYGPGNVALISRASWSNVASVTVGSQATDNTLRLSEIGRLYASNLVVGSADNADRNRVEVSGKGTSLQILNDLRVGFWGDSNSLIVAQGARVSAAQLYVGAFRPPGPLPAAYPGDANIALIHGTNTVVNVTSNLSVGSDGSWNRLELRAGAELTSSTVEVATIPNSTDNIIIITDPLTRWRNTNSFVLGSNGYRSSLTISDGARLSAGSAVLGDGGFSVVVGPCTNRFGFNSLLVTGEGALCEVAGQLIIGRNSTSNYVTVNQAGTLRANEIMAGFFGTACLPQQDENVFVLDGGNLIVTNRLFVGPRGRFLMLGGRAEVNSFWMEAYPSLRAEILGGTMRADALYASAPGEIRVGNASRRAILELTGGSYFSSGPILIASNSVLAGRGSISGGFTNAGRYGMLRAISAITNAILRGSSGFDVWIQGTAPGAGHSMLTLSAQHPAIEGRLHVALSPSFQPQPPNEFRIVTHGSVTGAFENAPDNSRIKTVDNLGSFLIRYTADAIVLSDYRSTDLDGDAIEDAWATNYFGHSPLTAADKSADNDGDGLSNYEEFRAGTDPTNAASALRVTARITSGAATLEWPCGDGKTYHVYFSDDMRTWREVGEPTFAFPEAGVCQWTDNDRDAGSTTGKMRFYRVSVD